MKCFLIRDLLPLYLEDDCSTLTKKCVEEHLKVCSDCKEMFDMMADPIDINDLVRTQNEKIQPNKSEEVWRRYYGRLIAKGTVGFLIIYVFFVFVAFLF
ncbi:zf-HC2 domain-containing protein [Bacillus pinisoli]|uniref:zf-HC2 domain-containing protein n=1 Tax=Bacillus pinisoli TaxID=2901866 RepID=UPI001FF434AF|nr:zf-HC2 domain-containing protein [Bacillus pinisoli]